MKKAVRRENGKSNIVGERLRDLRRERGLSQQQISDLLKVEGVHLDQKMLSAVERGVRTVADFELLAMAKCLEVGVGEMFEK